MSRHRALLYGIALLLAAGALWADELCLTGNARRQQNLPAEYTLEPAGLAALFDGSELDQKSAGMQDTTVKLTFREPVRVTRVAVVVYNDPQRSYNAAGRVQVAARQGETAVEETPWASLDGDAVYTCGQDGGLILGSKTEVALPGKAAADAVDIRLEKKPGAHQVLVREVYVWGLPERLVEAPVQALAGQVRDNTYSSLRATWTAAGGEYVRVRYRATGDKEWRSGCFARSPGVVLWLKPATTYEVAVEAVGEKLSAKPAPVQRVRLPHPLELRTMGDAWGMNFYPGGGGAHQPMPDEGVNTKAMLALLQEAGVRHVRWWPASPGLAELLAEQGMSLLPSVTFEDPARYQWLARECGVWLTQTTNEPDFAQIFAEDYVRQFIPRRAAAQRFSPLMCLAGPAIGGEMVGPGADYLRACYGAGLKDAVDAIDAHPYGKYATPAAPGAVVSGPEGLLASLAATREAMRAAGDADRPLIASETGHPTYEGRWFMPPSSYERQAQWIVRTNLLFVASGIRRVIWYAFQDEGTDKANPEHCFGIVDWYGKPKPAFAAYRTMTRLLSDAKCEGLQSGLSAPVYGVRCRLADGYLTALWDSGGESTVRVKAAGVRGMVSLTGEKLGLPRAVGGELALTVDESVRYVQSDRPLVILGHKRLTPPVAPQVQMSLSPATITVQPGQPAQWEVNLKSGFPSPLTVELECPNPWGLAGASATVTLQPGQSLTVPLSLPTPADAKRRQIISWDTRCHYGNESFCRAQFFMVP